MNLNIKDNHEINAIISNLQEADFEIIRDEVERLHEKRNPIFEAVGNHDADAFTKEACLWLDESDVDYQVKVSEFFWDVLTQRVTREYAINIFRAKHSYDEVA